MLIRPRGAIGKRELMSYVVVGNRFQKLDLFEKQVLYVDFVVDPETACPSEEERSFHGWLVARVRERRNLGEIAGALHESEPETKPAEAWERVDRYVGRLIERGVARAFRLVVVY